MRKNKAQSIDPLVSRYEEIRELMRQRDEISNKLSRLMSIPVQSVEISTSLPEDVSLNNEIIAILREGGKPMKIVEVKKQLDKKFNVNLVRRNVQGALVYMAGKKDGLIEKMPDKRGYFGIKAVG